MNSNIAVKGLCTWEVWSVMCLLIYVTADKVYMVLVQYLYEIIC